MTQQKGYFIVLEGADFGGKTTQVPKIAEWLRSLGLNVLTTREPGGTEVGDQIRKILTDPNFKGKITPETEAFLFQASRAQHTDEVIRPSLENETIIICDRYRDSSTVFQGRVRGVGTEVVASLNDISTKGLKPDLTLFFDVDVKETMRRMSLVDSKFLERIDLEPEDFHRMVIEQYRDLYEEDQKTEKRWRRVDAGKSEAQVFAQAQNIIENELLARGFIERPVLGKER